MTEVEELEDYLESILIGKVASIKYTDKNNSEQVEVDMVNRLAIDAGTRPRDFLILFTNNGKRIEVPLDNFKSHITLLN
jgi:glutamine synthetase type III